MGIDQFQLFGSVVQDLHQEFEHLFYVFLPVFFILAVVIEWFKNPAGSSEIFQILKRAFIAVVLMVGFREISGTINVLCDGIANRISDLSGIDALTRMAGEKASTYTMSPMSALLGMNDFLIAVLSFASYFILYLAKFVMVALYHFMWGLLTILSPLLILFTLFRGTVSITVNLFRSLIEVGCYKVIWAVLSAMITSLAFGNAYQAEGNYLTVIILNFIVALAMLATPLVVKSLVGSGLSQMSETLGMGAVVAIAATPTRMGRVYQSGRSILESVGMPFRGRGSVTSDGNVLSTSDRKNSESASGNRRYRVAPVSSRARESSQNQRDRNPSDK